MSMIIVFREAGFKGHYTLYLDEMGAADIKAIKKDCVNDYCDRYHRNICVFKLYIYNSIYMILNK